MQTNYKTQQIDRTVGYTVKEIMTPADALECWTGEEDKRADLVRVATENDYTYIPVRKNDVITGLIKLSDLRQNIAEDKITADWLIAADTPILQLFDLFVKQDHKERRNFLVLQSSQIVGLVSPADLNQIPARASVYLLVAHFEQCLANLIRHVLKCDEQRYIVAFPAKCSRNLSQAQTRQKQNTTADIKLDLLHYVFLNDLISIAANNEEMRDIFKLPDQPTAERELDVITVRNSVSHMTNIFIQSRENINAINDTCERLIKYGAIIKNYLA